MSTPHCAQFAIYGFSSFDKAVTSVGRPTLGASACARCRSPAVLEATNDRRPRHARRPQASAASAGIAGLPLFAELYHGWDRTASRATSLWIEMPGRP